MISLKPFQQLAVDSAVAVFDYMRGVLDQTGAAEAAHAILDPGVRRFPDTSSPHDR